MSEAKVLKIFIAPEAGEDMVEINEANAIESRGIIGDRYYVLSGTFSKSEIEPDQEITLIESEAFKELESVHGVHLDYSESRRNVVTSNVELNNLVGKQFVVGDATLKGMRLCEPCAYLSEKTGNSKLVKQWLHRAGLRASIVNSGKIKAGDSVIV